MHGGGRYRPRHRPLPRAGGGQAVLGRDGPRRDLVRRVAAGGRAVPAGSNKCSADWLGSAAWTRTHTRPGGVSIVLRFGMAAEGGADVGGRYQTAVETPGWRQHRADCMCGGRCAASAAGRWRPKDGSARSCSEAGSEAGCLEAGCSERTGRIWSRGTGGWPRSACSAGRAQRRQTGRRRRAAADKDTAETEQSSACRLMLEMAARCRGSSAGRGVKGSR